tara:strand:- start:59 stop:409 length:351 start_codon:yes stop_codon:yes gene_type:complete
MKTKCPVTNALTLIGGKWKINIIYLLSEKSMRFGELKKAIGSITQQMLSKQLKEMEKDTLINRKVYEVVPPKVEYSLTEFGRSSIPVLKSLFAWGNKKRKTINKVIDHNYQDVANL